MPEETNETTLPPQKVSTGIAGLDDVLGGGLPANRLYLIKGDPGSGKTTIGLQFVVDGLKHGENCLYVTLSESKRELLAVAQSHGWSLEGVEFLELGREGAGKVDEPASTFFHAWEMELTRMHRELMEAVERVKPNRLVFDSLGEIRSVADSPYYFRQQMAPLKAYLRTHHCTVIFTDERNLTAEARVDTLVHGVIVLEHRSPEYGVTRRRLIVEKVRGLGYREGYHDYVIVKGGLQVFPRLKGEPYLQTFKPENVPCNVEGLDRMLGGGLHRGTSCLILGPTGSGKSSVMLAFASASAARGEKALLCLFDENQGSLVHRGDELGLEISTHLREDTLEIRSFDPAELSPGQFTDWLRRKIEGDPVRLVGIDTLNGYMKAMPQESFLDLQIHQLFSYLAQKNVTTLHTMDLHGILSAREPGNDLSYIADTVVQLRYFDDCGVIKRSIAVVKKRSGPHEMTVSEFTIGGEGGLHVGEPLSQFYGVLTGQPASWVPTGERQVYSK